MYDVLSGPRCVTLIGTIDNGYKSAACPWYINKVIDQLCGFLCSALFMSNRFFYIMLFPSEVRFYGFENRSNTIDERICCSFCLTFQPAYTCLPLCLKLLGIDYNYMSKFPTSCCESYFVWDFYEHHIIIFFLGKVKKIRNRIFTFETYWSLIDFFFLSSCQRLMKAGIGSWFVTVFSKINFVFLVDISFLSEFGRVQVRLILGTNICKTAKS